MRVHRNLWGVLLVALGATALCAGMLVGAAGCCPELSAFPTGGYEIMESSERPELVGGMVEVTSDRVEVSFTDAEGQSWVVDYAVVDSD